MPTKKPQTKKGMGSSNLPKQAQLTFTTGWMGTRKTTDKLKEALFFIGRNRQRRVVFFLNNHDFIRETKKRILDFSKYNNIPISIRHLQGITQTGMCLEEGYLMLYRTIQNTKIICGRFCKRKDCPYQQQFDFKGVELIIAPKEYLNKGVIEKFSPDWIFFDDIDLKAKNDYSDFKESDMWYMYWKKQLDNSTKVHGMDKDQLFIVESYAKRIQYRITKIANTYITDIKNAPDYQSKIKVAEEFRKIRPIIQVDKHNFVGWKKHRLIHGKRNKFFSRPFLYNILDWTKKDVNVTIIGTLTLWSKNHLKTIFNRYKKETETSIMIKEENKQFPSNYKFGKVVTWLSHTNPHARWCRESLRDPVIRKVIKRRVKRILEEEAKAFNIPKFDKVKIGAVIVKEFATNINKLIPENKQALRVLTIGKERGSNKLLGVDIVFIIGTFLPNIIALVKECNRLYATNYPTSSAELTKRKIIIKDNELGWHFDPQLAPELENLRLMVINDTLIQSIGRGAFRGVDTYVFARIDPLIIDLFENKIGITIDYMQDKQRPIKQQNRLKLNDEILGIIGHNTMRLVDVHKELIKLKAQGKIDDITITRNKSRFVTYVKDCINMFDELVILKCTIRSLNSKQKGGRRGLCLRRNI